MLYEFGSWRIKFAEHSLKKNKKVDYSEKSDALSRERERERENLH